MTYARSDVRSPGGGRTVNNQEPSLAVSSDTGGSRSVERALRLVRAVAEARDGLSLTQAVQAVDLPTSTVARLFKSLEGAGFALRDDRGVYRSGPALLQIGTIAIDGLELDAVAAAHLRELAEVTGETAYLAVPDGPGAAIYVRQAESPRAIRHATWAGRSIGTAGTALGAAFEMRLNDDGFVTSRATPVEPDAAAAAAPITDKRGQVYAAISIIGPSFRLTDELLAEYGTAVVAHARTISATMLATER